MVGDALTLRESRTLPKGCKVDEENCVIKNVKILGRNSSNRHKESKKQMRYDDSALTGFAPLHEGARVCIGHLEEGEERARGYGEQLGDLRNVTSNLSEDDDEAGNYGDLHYNPAHPAASQFVYDAKNAPHRVAMSHSAYGRGSEGEEWHHVKEAIAVDTVDIVAKGGTVSSLYEAAKPAIVEEPEDMELKEEFEALKVAHAATVAELADARQDAAQVKAEADKIQEEARIAGLRAKLVEAGFAMTEKLEASLPTLTEQTIEAMVEVLKVQEGSPNSSDPATPPVQIKSTEEFVALL